MIQMRGDKESEGKNNQNKKVTKMTFYLMGTVGTKKKLL